MVTGFQELQDMDFVWELTQQTCPISTSGGCATGTCIIADI